jgi:putative membrane protein
MNRAAYETLCLAGVMSLASGLLATAAKSAVRNSTPTQSERRANTAYNDEISIRTAAETSMSQVDLGKLAEQKAQSPEVKKFAQLMVEEHAKITTQLKSLGMSEHINLPTSVARRDADTHRHLATESGAEFDRNYAQQVVTELEREITEFKQGASATTRPALKEFFERTQPTLESELQQAKQHLAHSR